MRSIYFWLMVLPFLTACSDSESVRLTGGTMGTTWSISIADFGESDLDQLHLAVMQRLAEINSLMSTWDQTSEISQFNQMPAGCMVVSSELAEVVDAALTISVITEGAYDVTLGPLIDLWGFGAVEQIDAPTQEELDAALPLTGFGFIDHNGESLCKEFDALEINLSSIAKGYGVDQVADLLAEWGYENFLVEIGGELYASGDKYGEAWRVGVENPASMGGQSAMLALALENQAVATSGDYRNFFMLDGKRYSHIIDARTGRPVDNQIASVTVIADSVMKADAWATALMAVGPDRAQEIADQQGLLLLLVLRDDEDFRVLPNLAWIDQFGEPN